VVQCCSIEWTVPLVLQENPSRILKYRASTLHLYGWVPFLIWRNVKATVFGNYRLYLQSIVLVSWMVVIHLTGAPHLMTAFNQSHFAYSAVAAHLSATPL
jgi:hypothetical protein